MKIAMVMSTPMPPQEGIGNHVYNISRRLVEQGHRVTVITRGSWKAETSSEMQGIKVYRARYYPVYPLHVHLHGLFVNALLNRIGQLDVVHLHTPLVPTVRVASPVITTVHTPMLIDARHAETANALGLAIKLQAPVSFQLEKALIRGSSLVATVSRSVAEELGSYGLRSDSIVITRNGVDHDVFTPPPQESESERYVLTVGRLAYRKGLFDIVRCAALVAQLHPGVRFLLAGSGPLEPSVRALVARLGLEDKVRFVGPLGYQSTRLVELYQSCAAYLQASHYEGLPGSLLEAMACGRPVVATSVSGHVEVISPGENGLLTPPGSPKSLADAVCALLGNRALAQRLGAAARRTVEGGYTWDIVTQRVLDCYERARNGEKGPP